MKVSKILLLALSFILIILPYNPAYAAKSKAKAKTAVAAKNPNKIEITIPPTGGKQVALTLQVLLLLAVLTLAPAIAIMMTSFIRISIVLLFTRNALATQQLPPTQVIMALSIFLTVFIMWPTFSKVYTDAIVPMQEGKIGLEEAYKRGIKPIRNFMFKQMTQPSDYDTLSMFYRLAHLKRPKTPEDVPTHILIPTFMLNELRKAFIMGIFIFIPFVIIDIIVASVLLSIGIIFLPPVMVSLPFKIILFVLVDGWRLLTEQIILSFNL